jgi:acetyl esterase/lipase
MNITQKQFILTVIVLVIATGIITLITLKLTVGKNKGAAPETAQFDNANNTAGENITRKTDQVDISGNPVTAQKPANTGTPVTPASPSTAVTPTSSTPIKDIEYKKVSGVDSSLLKLDVYPVAGISNAPVVLFIHGGSWTSGDKSYLKRGEKFADFFHRNKAVLVSANFRLVNSKLSPNTTYKEQASDIASAVRWIRDNISRYGGDSNKLGLMGFSSGAHLVPLVGTDSKYLKAVGLDTSIIDTIMALDVNAYDIPTSIAEGKNYNYPAAATNLPVVFTSNIETQKDASPMYHLSTANKKTAFLIVYAGEGGQTISKRQSELFVDALTQAGFAASAYGNLSWTHSQLAIQFGETDFPLTGVSQDFLDTYLW